MQAIHILLVEDNEGDIFLTTEALEDSKILNTVEAVRNGKLALDYVFKQGDYKNCKTPDLILLDINLPLKNGHEVLQILKNDERTKKIPIIMLTTSSSEKDINLSYKHHANTYVTKPVEAENFLKAIVSIENFWLSVVKFPSKN